MITENMTKDLIEIKNFLLKNNKTDFSRREFMTATYSSDYYFRQMIDIGLIINTGKIYPNLAGNPIAYKLNPSIMHPDEQKKYKLTNEDVAILIKSKDTKLITLNDSVKTMRNQINNLKKEKNALMQYKVN